MFTDLCRWYVCADMLITVHVCITECITECLCEGANCISCATVLYISYLNVKYSLKSLSSSCLSSSFPPVAPLPSSSGFSVGGGVSEDINLQIKNLYLRMQFASEIIITKYNLSSTSQIERLMTHTRHLADIIGKVLCWLSGGLRKENYTKKLLNHH